MSEIYTCNRGFLIERHKDGSYTPFFVKVRREDIIGDDSGGGGGGASGDVSIKTISGWTCENVNNNYINASKPITIDGAIFHLNSDDPSELYATVELPYPIASEDSFCATANTYGRIENISTAVVTITPIKSGARVSSIKISLRNLVYTFPHNWDSDPQYLTSKVYVRVSGMI